MGRFACVAAAKEQAGSLIWKMISAQIEISIGTAKRSDIAIRIATHRYVESYESDAQQAFSW